MNERIVITLISGPPGVGKTTIIKKLTKFLTGKSIKYDGFYTEELRDSNPPYNRLGFDIIKFNTNEREILARQQTANTTNRHYPKIGKYSVFVKEFEKLALSVFNEASNCIIIDEIGKMELLSDQFMTQIQNTIVKLKSGTESIKLIATIPNATNIHIIMDLQKLNNVKVFHVTKTNRNNIITEIENCCFKMFSSTC